MPSHFGLIATYISALPFWSRFRSRFPRLLAVGPTHRELHVGNHRRSGIRHTRHDLKIKFVDPWPQINLISLGFDCLLRDRWWDELGAV